VDIRLERRPPGTGRRGLALAAALAAASVLTACTAGSAPTSSSPAVPSHTSPEPGTSDISVAPRGGGPAWLLTRSALARLLADPVARDELRSSRIYEILQPGQRALAGVSAEPVVTFASATALEDAVSRGQLAAGTYGVLYDPEAWSFTPVAEQRDPVLAATHAAAVAHAHDLRLLVAPALNLTTVLNPDRTPRWQQFLALNLAGHLARVADFVELQAQSLERDTAAYTSFVRSATAQAVAANRQITVLAGLSTNPPGAPVDSQHLTAAIDATRSAVAGYWLNIPGQGARCPTCNPSRPDLAIQVLRQLH
jgi:hypothetical protein